jgi:hypothetical protein
MLPGGATVPAGTMIEPAAAAKIEYRCGLDASARPLWISRDAVRGGG